ncbi:hypothetical protein DFS34DRAFT_602534 [Phlyctochytrium arcticum]|nr:hypothetical protein DFS34DRAFT_602534 [Phlyctochytrium arcticum]
MRLISRLLTLSTSVCADTSTHSLARRQKCWVNKAQQAGVGVITSALEVYTRKTCSECRGNPRELGGSRLFRCAECGIPNSLDSFKSDVIQNNLTVKLRFVCSQMPISTFFPSLIFPQPYYVPPWLVSFHLVRFAYFFLAANVLPYVAFRILGQRWKWECDPKSPAVHYRDHVLMLNYAFVLFVLGNYSVSFSWPVLVIPSISIFAFAWIGEHDALRHSFATLANWNSIMWTVVTAAVSVILAFAGYHMFLAVTMMVPANAKEAEMLMTGSATKEQMTGCILGWYLIALVGVPLLLVVPSILTLWYQNGGYKQHRRLVGRTRSVWRRSSRRSPPSSALASGGNMGTSGPIPSQPALESDTSTGEVSNSAASVSAASSNSPGPWRPARFHPHHWAIFYFLAFFTRFEDVVSQIAAGILIGIYIHGVAAYGYHDMLDT